MDICKIKYCILITIRRRFLFELPYDIEKQKERKKEIIEGSSKLEASFHQ
jgi:hypothetical protein